MKNEEIKTILENQKVTFNVKGHTEYSKKDDGEWGYIAKLFRTQKHHDNEPSGSISDKYGFNQMNIDKFGPSSFTVYTFDLMGKRTRARIKYQDVTLIL
jgi:hypothetical protein